MDGKNPYQPQDETGATSNNTLQINGLCYTLATLLTQLLELTQIRMMIFKKWRSQ